MSAATAAALISVLLTPQQVAELLAVPVSWVYSHAEAGTLPSEKIGKYRRFRREEIERWLTEQRGK